MKTTRATQKKQRPRADKSLGRRNRAEGDVLKPIRQYLQSIEYYQPLSREEEIELALRGRAGDEAALEKLVTSNLRFVISVALEYTNRGLSMAELVSEGNMGLLKAVGRFDPKYGCKFITYAVWWMRQSIHEGLYRFRSTTQLSLNRLSDLKQLKREANNMSQRLGMNVSLQEASASLGREPRKTGELLSAAQADVHLDAPVREGANETWAMKLSDRGDDVENEIVQEELAQVLRRGLENLDTREAHIIGCYFGLDGKRGATLEEIGSSIGITRERVRQLRDRALKKIRENQGSVLAEFVHN